MSKIINSALISHVDGNEYATQVNKSIDMMQRAGLEVEVQYHPMMSETQIVFTAMIYGREVVSQDNE